MPAPAFLCSKFGTRKRCWWIKSEGDTKVWEKALSVFLAFTLVISLSPFSMQSQYRVAYAQGEQTPVAMTPVAGDDQASQTPSNQGNEAPAPNENVVEGEEPEAPADNNADDTAQPGDDDATLVNEDEEDNDALEPLATIVNARGDITFDICWNDDANQNKGRPQIED